MTEQAVNPRLGRGLTAFMGDDDEPAPERELGQRKIPVEFLRRNPRNDASLCSSRYLADVHLIKKAFGINLFFTFAAGTIADAHLVG